MNQNRIVSNTLSVKSPPNFDTIPEDIALSIVKSIQSWVKAGGTKDQREWERKARDSTLRAAALTSSKTFETYFTSLIQHVTLNMIQTFSFCQVLERGDPHYGSLVRSIRFEESADYLLEEDLKILQALGASFSILPRKMSLSKRAYQGVQEAIGRCYRQLINLQSLVMLDPFIAFRHFHHKIGEQSKPHFFLNSSLKRLFIQSWEENSINPNLNAKNATWLLVFCQLEEATLAFDLSVDNSKYLSEFAQTFAGSSSVKKLAIKVHFVYLETKKQTWWGCPEEQNANLKQGNRKTESIINFLQSTNHLDALEINIPASEAREGDRSEVSLDCLSALSRSLHSLRHLRLLGEIFGDVSLSLWSSCSFRVLRVVTLDLCVMSAFPLIDLPQSIETLYLPRYVITNPEEAQEDDEGDFEEEKLIRDMIDNKCFASLEEVVVPSRPIAANGEETAVPHQTKSWAERRSALEAANAFKGGNIKSRTVEVGEIVGDALKGEVFWSTIKWLSPP